MNRYNNETRIVKPEQSQAYAITPQQAQQLDRLAMPQPPVISVPGQSSETQINVSAIFTPLEVKEQFSPTERANGFMLRSAPFVGGALLISLAAVWKMNLTRIDGFFLFSVCFLIALIILNRQEATHSAAGLALRHQAAASDALTTIVASNESVTLAKLENEDRAHAREIDLRRELTAGYLKQLGGNRE